MDVSNRKDISAQILDAATQIFNDIKVASVRPSVLYRPALSIDGNQWCALYGDNLQVGVAGFGYTPEEAMAEFDRNWTKRL
ncbi:hypothetical protein D3C85_1592150 [compost metagenome]